MFDQVVETLKAKLKNFKSKPTDLLTVCCYSVVLVIVVESKEMAQASPARMLYLSGRRYLSSGVRLLSV